MAKNSTLFSNAPFISPKETDLKEKAMLESQSPSDTTIANILAFSKALKVEKSNQTGLIEMVLN
jgi:hypothetical protein